jgi:hypothetical protein
MEAGHEPAAKLMSEPWSAKERWQIRASLNRHEKASLDPIADMGSDQVVLSDELRSRQHEDGI